VGGVSDLTATQLFLILRHTGKGGKNMDRAEKLAEPVKSQGKKPTGRGQESDKGQGLERAT